MDYLPSFVGFTARFALHLSLSCSLIHSLLSHVKGKQLTRHLAFMYIYDWIPTPPVISLSLSFSFLEHVNSFRHFPWLFLVSTIDKLPKYWVSHIRCAFRFDWFNTCAFATAVANEGNSKRFDGQHFDLHSKLLNELNGMEVRNGAFFVAKIIPIEPHTIIHRTYIYIIEGIRSRYAR